MKLLAAPIAFAWRRLRARPLALAALVLALVAATPGRAVTPPRGGGARGATADA